jgi:hypothetical protein
VTAGALPAGLALSTAGAIAGTPTGFGTATFTAQVTDASAQVQSRQFTLTINPVALTITTGSLPDGTAGSAYSTTISTSGGAPPITFSLAQGSLPAGLSISSGGTISGTPTVVGNSTFRVQASDAAAQTVTRQFHISVAATSLVINTSTLPNGTTGSAYNTTLSVSGGVAPYNWSVTAGTLPAGLNLSASEHQSSRPR